MLDGNTLKFLIDLNFNNSKEWFENNRANYELARDNILTVTGQLISDVSDFDPSIADAHLDPKKCITRLNRDLRFSKDKTPYKTDYFILITKTGKNGSSAFYCLHIEPDNCFAGGGVYVPLPEQLHKIRQEIDRSFDQWKAIITSEPFKKQFPSGIHHSGVLMKIPRGFDTDSPAADFLKMKGFVTMRNISNKEITMKTARARIIDCFRDAKPLVDFLNLAMDKDL